MQAIRDLSDTLNLQPATFNTLIILVILVGGLWAAIRLYQDLTRPLSDESTQESPQQEV